MMNRFKQRFMVIFMPMLLLNYFVACAHKETTETAGIQAEVWELKITGDTEGTLKMVLRRAEIKRDTYSIAGEFSGNIIDHIGGQGQCVCKFKGKIEKNILSADFYGPAMMAGIGVQLTGTIKGNVSDSEGLGTFSLIHSMGSSDGEWTIKKIKPE